MRNFAYKDETGKIIVGVIVSDDIKKIEPIVPEGYYFYTYNEGDNVENLFSGTPAGTGKGKKID